MRANNLARRQVRRERLARRLTDPLLDRVRELRQALGFRTRCRRAAKTPPAWVFGAIDCLFAGPLAYLEKIDFKKRKRISIAEYGKLVGVVQAATAVMGLPNESEGKQDRHVPPLDGLQKMFREQGAVALKELGIKSARNKQAKKKKRVPFTPLQKVQFQRGYNEGWRLIFDEDGKPIDDDSQTTEICFALWWFWPELKFARTTRDIHLWLCEMSSTSIGIKSVEAICTQIGFFKRRRKKRASDVLIELPSG